MKGSLLGDINTAAGDMLCFALLCSLAGWMDRKLCLDQIRSDWIKFSFVKVRSTPWCEEKFHTKQCKTIKSFIFVLSQSIFTRNTISIQFKYKNCFSLLVSFQVFKFSSFMSEEPIISREDDTTLEAFFIFKVQ